MKIKNIRQILLLVIICGHCTIIEAQVKSSIHRLEEEGLALQNYVPWQTPDYLLENPIRSRDLAGLKGFSFQTLLLAEDQADWLSLSLVDSTVIESIRVFGFDEPFSPESAIDDLIIEENTIKLFCLGTNSNYAVRYPLSDIQIRIGGTSDYYGVIQFRMQSKESEQDEDNGTGSNSVLVGVGRHAFYLGGARPNLNRTFYSMPLAEALRRHLKEKHKREISDDIFDRISGKSRLVLPEEFNVNRE